MVGNAPTESAPVKYQVDIVTVFHNENTHRLHLELRDALSRHEPDGRYRLIGVDNRQNNRGFAVACNLGALHPSSDAPIVGFLNPDAVVAGPFIDIVTSTLKGPVVITGCRYGKPDHELAAWGVSDWVCGAAMFVTRKWFESVRGFDEQFEWSWEETDLIRQAEAGGLECRATDLPIAHESPSDDSDADHAYKKFHFQQGQRRFARKWARRT